ncbi:MAG: SpoIID/LytB domain-containing protein [Lachnospiraceae bacterium]|nr:SpoIID/LytB domain-containing protein [Lachnospiraceae bacterium]
MQKKSGGTGPESETQNQNIELEENGIQGTDAEKAAEPENTEPEPLPYTGQIRVLLKTDGFAETLHEKVSLASEHGSELTLTDRETGEKLDSGSQLELTREDGVLFLNGEPLAETPICLRVTGEDARIRVNSLIRSGGHPVYEGALELWPTDGGFYLVNEVPLETYLAYVVPSEMPSGYHMEALKAQAVCARTYAYQELSTYAYPDCEAHVDDSVSFQVYGNTGRTAGTDRAVAETAGQILTCQGSPITAYYFSTSCGATGNQEVWWDGDQTATPYLAGKTVDAAGEAVDLSKEEEFNAFLEADHPDGYDADISWYRWETEIDNKTLSENLNQALAGRIAANPNAVLTRLGSRLESRTIKNIGRIRGIDVLERNEGGAVTKLQIRGSRHTIEVSTEYNARALLNVQGGSIRRRDGSRVEGGMLLPSACMRITPLFDEKGELSGWRFTGGGYGHGVGLSQNGANGMAKQGKGYGEILHFFYTDVELTDISEI